MKDRGAETLPQPTDAPTIVPRRSCEPTSTDVPEQPDPTRLRRHRDGKPLREPVDAGRCATHDPASTIESRRTAPYTPHRDARLMATILGIESTCDETGAAVVVDGCDVRSNVVASQVELHAKYRGVVPEIASRAAHREHPAGDPRSARRRPACGFADLDAIAVAHRPGSDRLAADRRHRRQDARVVAATSR